MTSGSTETCTSVKTRRAGSRTRSDRMVLALVCACQFMVILDAAIVNVALPSIRRDLGFTPTSLAVLWPTLLVAAGIGLTFPTLMAAATAGVAEADAGITGGLANTASQVGGSIGLAALATAATMTTATHAGGHSSAALAAGYDQVFLIAAGVGLAIAAVSRLLPHAPTAARHEAPRGVERAPAQAC